jgi:hypothetical protein
MKKSLLILALVLAAHSDAFGQWVPTFGPYGGNVFCFATLGQNEFTGTDCGVFKSTNNGTYWAWSSNGLNKYILSLTVSGPNLLAGSLGIFLSTDSGISWNRVDNNVITSSVMAFATIDSNLFAGVEYGGVLVSTDHGKSWKSTATMMDTVFIKTLAVNGAVLYAGGAGAYRSTDLGITWTPIGLTTTNEVLSLVTLGTKLFAGTQSGGLLVSADSGNTWNEVENDLTSSSTSALYANGSNLFAGTVNGAILSADSGNTWEPAGLSNYSIWCFAANDTNLFAGTEFWGAFLSTNDGTSWTSIDSGLPTYSSVGAFATSGSTLYTGTADGFSFTTNNGDSWSTTGLQETQPGTLAVIGSNIFAGTRYNGLFLSTDDGISWSPLDSGLTDTNVLDLMADEGNLFAGTENGVFLSPGRSAKWVAVDSGIPPYTEVDALTSIGNNIIAGTVNGIFQSTNNGSIWKLVDSNLKNFNPDAFAVNGSNLFVGTIYGGGVFLSTDSGVTWTNTGLTNTYVTCLLSIGTNLFAGTQGQGIYLTTDNGLSWDTVNTGLTNFNIYGLSICDSDLFAGVGTAWEGVWRRPLSEIIPVPSAVETQAPIQSSISAYPNPLSQSTTIRFISAESGVARVTVVNLLGEEVARVFEGALTAGEHSFMWSKPTGLPDGIYECVVEMNGSVQQVPVVVSP